MSDLMKFDFESLTVRSVLLDGTPWFVAVDVCRALEISNPSLVVNGRERIREDGSSYWSGGLDDDEKGIVTVNTPGGRQEMLCVNESGVYSLVFQSRKSEAKTFKRWITHDVIPSIRKTGRYESRKADVVPMDERQVRVELLKTALDHEERLTGIEDKINQVERKVDEQITLDSGEQRVVQKAVAKRVYSMSDESTEQRRMFRELYREIKDRWAVPSYKDVRRTELQEVIRYIEAWRPKAA